MSTCGLAAAAAWVADRRFGEPPARWHPVAWFGTAMRRVETGTYRDCRVAGVVHLALGAGLAAGVGVALRRVLGRGPATAFAATVAIAGRMLADEATAVLDQVTAGDLPAARGRVRALVGRDMGDADASAITRAVIESVAENTVDAVTAPLLWATVGGAPAVLAHRAVNTLDAMVGHRDDHYGRFGWAAARADDAANWLPARLSVAAVAVVAPRRARDVVRTVRRDARQHPSPNGGVIEAAFAGALRVRLGGVNRYGAVTEDRGALGDGEAPTVADARAAIRLAARLTAMFAAACALTSLPRRPPWRRELRRWELRRWELWR